MHAMLKLAGLGLVVVVLTLALVVVAVASSWGGICETVVHSQSPAPARATHLWVYGKDCGAVASLTTTTVTIGTADARDRSEDERVTAVFRARVDRSSPLRMGAYGPAVLARWTSDSALTIRYDPRIDVELAVVRVRGITVQYDTLP